jgi:molecular chaperone GrpE
MTTGKRRIPINDHGPAQDAAESPAGAQADSAQADSAPVAEPTSPAATEAVESKVPGAEAPALEDVIRERDALLDALLRLRAEFDNFRKRSARELVEARERSQGELLGELLPVLDNLERALDAAEHHDEGKVLGGVRMTKDMFVNLLNRMGVQEIETVGTPFNPELHDAILTQASDKEEGIITAVLEKGYKLGDRVLRPARVAVSSGPEAEGER